MKKIFPLFLLITLSLSCTRDDNEVKPSRSNLIGKWYFDSSAKGDEVTDYDNKCATYRDGIEFLDNGYTNVNAANSDCTISTDGSGKWALDDFELTISNDDVSTYLRGTFRVQQLSEFNMTLLQKVTPATGSTYNKYYYLVKN